jgi:LysM repeat protein
MALPAGLHNRLLRYFCIEKEYLMEMKRLLIVLALVALLGLAACSRSATPSNPEALPGTDSDLPFPTSEFPQMDILQTAAVATQTALAGAGGGQPGQGTEVAPQPTSPPAQAGPTNTPAPTAVPKPTATQEPVDCDSPYTVQKGEWVYSIGRKCGVDPNTIIQLNGLYPPYLLYPGDKLILR